MESHGLPEVGADLIEYKLNIGNEIQGPYSVIRGVELEGNQGE